MTRTTSRRAIIEILARFMKLVLHRSRLTSSYLDASTLDSAANVAIAITAALSQYAKLKPET
jgi:hypothetical protein